MIALLVIGSGLALMLIEVIAVIAYIEISERIATK